MQPKFSKWEKKGEPLLEFRVIWTDEVFEISSESLESHENPHQNLLVRAQPTSLCHCLGTWFKDFLMENIEFWPNWTWVCCELGLENFIWAFFTIMYLKGHSWYWKRPMKIFPSPISSIPHVGPWFVPNPFFQHEKVLKPSPGTTVKDSRVVSLLSSEFKRSFQRFRIFGNSCQENELYNSTLDAKTKIEFIESN